MSKKMMKRSLVLGALMAFVITGSAMAAVELGEINATSVEDFQNKSGLVSAVNIDGHPPAFTFAKANTDSADKLVTTEDITYSGRFGLYAAYLIEDKNPALGQNPKEIRLDNPNGNVLEIKSNLTVNDGDVYLYGAGTGWGYDGNDIFSSAEGNSVVVVGEGDKPITIKAGSNVFIGGAIALDSHDKRNVVGNTVVVDNVKFELPEGSSVVISGAEAKSGSAKSNEVTLKDVVINENNIASILGGFMHLAKSGSYSIGDAETNVLTLNNVTALNSKSEFAGGYVQEVNGSSIGNIINIVDSKIAGKVYGGYSEEGVANKNVVTISGGSINGQVYGGYGKNGSNNNTVTISGSADVSVADIYGGNVADSTGNTLNIAADWAKNTIKSINNFNEINIEEAKWGEAAVNVTGTLALNDTVVNVDTVRVAGDDETFAPGKSSAVITSNSEINGNVAGGKVNVFRGVATIYEASVVKEANDIKIKLGDENTAEYNAAVMNPQVLVIGEARAAATAFTNQGSELIETGLDVLARDKATDTKAFAAVYGNTSEFATGSEVKVNGWSGIVGVGKTNANGLTVGAFFENGEGNYRTYNNVNNEFMRGDGEACYNGGGFIIRKDNANGVYTEASLRAGNLQNELRNAVHGSEGLTGYDIDTFYYGAHVGIGKVIPRGNEGDSIDVYGKFIYTHHNSEDFTIDGDKFHFDSVDSERLRLGFRINEAQTNKLSMYYGAAWEYEFGGDADNTVVGYDLSTPSLGGSTVIGEVGMHYKANEKWNFDMNVRGYGGQRDGFTGSVQANYNF